MRLIACVKGPADRPGTNTVRPFYVQVAGWRRAAFQALRLF